MKTTNQTTFSIITGDHELQLEQFGPTAFIQLRRPTEDVLEILAPVVDITGEEEWDPYGNNERQQTFSSLQSHLSDDICDWLLEYPT